MQFLITVPPDSNRKKKVACLQRCLNDLGLFFQISESRLRKRVSWQIEMTWASEATRKGFFILDRFERQLTEIETNCRNQIATSLYLKHRRGKEQWTVDTNLFAWLYFVISHREETLIASVRKDRHDRIPFKNSTSFLQDWINEPRLSDLQASLFAIVVDYCRNRGIPLLKKAPWPEGKKSALVISHDIDVLDKWWLYATALGSEAIKRGKWKQAAAIGLRSIKHMVNRSNPVDCFHELLQLESRFRFRASWHFMVGKPTLRSIAGADITYSAEAITQYVDLLRRFDAEIALHASYHACSDESLFAEQCRGLRNMVGYDGTEGVRAHFLRFNGTPFFRLMENHGFGWDGSLGFGERPGFKSGLATPFQPYDHDADRQFDIWEFPLNWMDRTFSKYSTGSVEDMYRNAVDMADCCFRRNGLFALLWHNYSVSDLGFGGYETLYNRILEHFHNRNVYNDQPRRIAQWLDKRKKATIAVIDSQKCIVQTSQPPAPLSLCPVGLYEIDCAAGTYTLTEFGNQSNSEP